MASKQFTEFGKGQIVAYNDCELPFQRIAKKLNYLHSSIDVFLKNYKKTGNYHQKRGYGLKREITASEDPKIVTQLWQQWSGKMIPSYVCLNHWNFIKIYSNNKKMV